VEGASLKLVKEIGSDEKDYLFVRIMGAVLSKKKDIYVIDSKGNFLARYNWNGKFVKRIGRFGRGPGDFHIPAYLNIFDEKLYLWDMGNRRVVQIELDLELKTMKYYTSHDGMPFWNNFHIIDKNKCVGNSMSFSVDYNKEYKAIKILDFENQVSEMFFSKVPHEGLKNPKKNNYSNLFWYMPPRIGIDTQNKQMVIAFIYPKNPIDFFVYSYDLECVDKFSYNFDETYRYPEFILKGQSPPPKKRTTILVHAIFVHKGLYIVMVAKNNFKDLRDYDQVLSCLVFDAASKELKHRFTVPSHLEFFSISEHGYLLATKHYEETPKLYIFKLEL
jgi:hypothetical protein